MSQRTQLKYLILLIIVCLAAAYNIIHVRQYKDQDFENNSEELSSLINVGDDTTTSAENIIDIQRQAELLSKSNLKGNGAITVSLDEGFYQTHVVLKTQDPAADRLYEAWLRKNKPRLEWYSLGELSKKDDTYELNHLSELDRSDFPEIIITEETEKNGFDGKPGKVLFSGTFETEE